MSYIYGGPLVQMTHLGRDVVKAGLVVGSGGNLSVRDGDCCWVTSSGSWLDRLTSSEFCCVSLADFSTTSSAKPTSELQMHLAVYLIRPDVNVVVHLHPQSLLLLDALGESVRLVTTDHKYYLEEVETVSYSPPGSSELAYSVIDAISTGVNCVVLSHHGCLVLADSVELAHKRVLNLEEAAVLTYRAIAVGAENWLKECPDLPELI